MARKRPIVECAFCGELRPATDDHIPPESMYLTPLPTGRPFVRTCEKCNGGRSMDDEYFRDSVLKYFRVAEQEAVVPLVEKMLRAAALPAKAGYTRRVLESFTVADVYSTGGIYLGRQEAFRVDHKRVQRTAERYIAGLHAFEFNRRVPAGFIVKAHVEPESLHIHSELILENLKHGRLNVVQPETFLYMYYSPPAAPSVSAWLLLFYNQFPVLGFVRPLFWRPPG